MKVGGITAASDISSVISEYLAAFSGSGQQVTAEAVGRLRASQPLIRKTGPSYLEREFDPKPYVLRSLALFSTIRSARDSRLK